MRTEAHADSPGDLLREKLVAFQREIAELKQQAKEREETNLRHEHGLYAELFEVIDLFDTIELHLRRKPEPLDKSGHHLLNSMRAVHRKLLRLLHAHQIEPLEFPERQAHVSQCTVVETKRVPGRENEEILAVLKRGYRDAARDIILRKADVVTVRNDQT